MIRVPPTSDTVVSVTSGAASCASLRSSQVPPTMLATMTWRAIRHGPGNPQAADRRDVPGGRGGRGRGDGARDCGFRGEVGHEPVEFGPRLGCGSLLHPLAELIQRQPPVPGGPAEPLDGGIPLGIGGPDAPGWLVVRGFAHRCLQLRCPRDHHSADGSFRGAAGLAGAAEGRTALPGGTSGRSARRPERLEKLKCP